MMEKLEQLLELTGKSVTIEKHPIPRPRPFTVKYYFKNNPYAGLQKTYGATIEEAIDSALEDQQD